MKSIELDSEKCQGHAMCAGYAPTLIDVDDLGFAVLLGTGALRSQQETDEAERAQAGCPENAIRIVEAADV